GHSRGFRRLETRNRDTDAPPVPRRPLQRIAERLRGAAAKRRLGDGIRKFAANRFAGKVFRECLALRAAALGRLSFHRPLFERLQNLLRSQLAKDVATRGTRIAACPGLMTDGTVLLVKDVAL